MAVRDEEGQIEGGVIDVTPAELRRIDWYEGEEYERARVTLASGTRAWVHRRPKRRG